MTGLPFKSLSDSHWSAVTRSLNSGATVPAARIFAMVHLPLAGSKRHGRETKVVPQAGAPVIRRPPQLTEIGLESFVGKRAEGLAGKKSVFSRPILATGKRTANVVCSHYRRLERSRKLPGCRCFAAATRCCRESTLAGDCLRTAALQSDSMVAKGHAPVSTRSCTTRKTMSCMRRAATLRLRLTGRATIHVMRKPSSGLAERRPALTRENTPQDGSTV